MKTFRCIRHALLIAAIAVPLVACGSKTDGDASAADTPVETVPADTPSVEPTGPETPRPKDDDDVAVSVPSLPVGGGPDESFQTHQCVTASWLGDREIPDGVAVRVTKVLINPAGVFDLGGGCAGKPGCRSSFAYTSARPSCSIAVTAKQSRGKSADLALVGEVRCPTGNRTCVDFARNAKGNSQLESITQPGSDEDEPEQRDSEESPPSPTG